MADEDKLASASDVQNDAESFAWSEIRKVTLPKSRRKITVKMPTEVYFALRKLEWPEDLQVKCENAASVEELQPLLTAADLRVFGADRRRLLREAIVSPKVNRSGPKAERFDPAILHEMDKDFLHRFLRGQVEADATDLESFRAEQPQLTGDGGGAGDTLPGPDAGAVLETTSR